MIICSVEVSLTQVSIASNHASLFSIFSSITSFLSDASSFSVFIVAFAVSILLFKSANSSFVQSITSHSNFENFVFILSNTFLGIFNSLSLSFFSHSLIVTSMSSVLFSGFSLGHAIR